MIQKILQGWDIYTLWSELELLGIANLSRLVKERVMGGAAACIHDLFCQGKKKNQNLTAILDTSL